MPNTLYNTVIVNFTIFGEFRVFSDNGLSGGRVPIFLDKIEYLTSKEAAAFAGRTTDTIDLWCRLKKVEARQDGSRRWLVRRSSLEKFVRGDHGNGSNKRSTRNN